MNNPENNDKPQPNPRSKNTRRPRWSIALAIIITLLAAGATFFFLNGGFNNNSDDPAAIIDRVNKLILLPEGEPKIDTVQDAAAMKAQQGMGFFKNVENSDKILIYAEAAQIFIYRPATNTLINVGPIVDDTTQTKTE